MNDTRDKLQELIPSAVIQSGFYPEGGERYQIALCELITVAQPDVVVETGIDVGCSTAHILHTLDKIGKGALYSCDPSPRVSFAHSRWHVYREISLTALPKIFIETGPWDFFLHDSDHSSTCQTFEYALAYQLLKPGGFIASDDWFWCGKRTPEPHRAWERFCARNGITFKTMGACAIAQKPTNAAPPSPELLRQYTLDAYNLAAARDKELGEETPYEYTG